MSLESHGRFFTKSPGISSLSRSRSGPELLEPGPGGAGFHQRERAVSAPSGSGSARLRAAAPLSDSLWGSAPRRWAPAGTCLTPGRALP